MSNAYKGYKLTKRSTNQFLKLIVIIFYNYDQRCIIHFFSMVVFTLAREEASWCMWSFSAWLWPAMEREANWSTGVGCIRAWTRAYHRRCQKKKGLPPACGLHCCILPGAWSPDWPIAGVCDGPTAHDAGCETPLSDCLPSHGRCIGVLQSSNATWSI